MGLGHAEHRVRVAGDARPLRDAVSAGPLAHQGSQAEAEAIYQKRRAELKAEAEHADERLDLLDKRVHLASLGFREVVRKVAPEGRQRRQLSRAEARDRAGPLAQDAARSTIPRRTPATCRSASARASSSGPATC